MRKVRGTATQRGEKQNRLGWGCVDKGGLGRGCALGQSLTGADGCPRCRTAVPGPAAFRPGPTREGRPRVDYTPGNSRLYPRKKLTMSEEIFRQNFFNIGKILI